MTSAAELKRLIGKRKAITVPGTANALFARVICEKIAPRAYWRMPQPKFFKQCRRLAGSRIGEKVVE